MMKCYSPGCINLVSGKPGSGKTDFTLRLIESALKKNPDLSVITNIPITRKTPRIYHYSSLSGILWYIVVLPRLINALDEAGIYASTGAGDDHHTRGILERILKISRKFQTSTFWIDQNVIGSVPPQIRNMASYLWEKTDLNHVDIFTIDGGDINYFRSSPVPYSMKTRIPYNTLGFSSLKMDITPKEIRSLFDQISTKPTFSRRDLGKWLITHSLAPPQNDLFKTWHYEREVKEREEKKDTITKAKIEIDPGDPVDTRTLVYGILQRSHRTTNKALSKLLNVHIQTIRHYRKEYTGKIKPREIEEKEIEIEIWDPVPIVQ